MRWTLRWTLAAGLVGSCLLLVAGLTYARVPVDSRVRGLPLRHLPHHLQVGLLVALLGLVLLVVAWLGLVREAGAVPDGVRRTRTAVAAWCLPLLVAPPLFSNDGWSYVATGFLGGHGRSPYVATPSLLAPALRSAVDPTWRRTTSPYGPLPLVWGSLVAKVSSDPWVMLLAHRLLAVGGVALLAVSVVALARRCGADPGRASALAVANPLVVVHGVGGLHNDVLVAALATAALAVTTDRHWWWGAVLVGLAAAVKLPGLAAVPGVLLLGVPPGSGAGERLRRGVQSAVVAVATLVVSSLAASGLLGWGDGLGWVHALGRTAEEKAKLAPTALVAHWLRLGPSGRDVVIDAGLLALLGVAVWVALLRPRHDDEGAVVGGGLVLLAVALLSPALHYWYFLWSLPVLAATRLGRRGELVLIAFLVALGLTAVADPAVHVPWFAPAALVVLVVLPLGAWLMGRRASARRTLARS